MIRFTTPIISLAIAALFLSSCSEHSHGPDDHDHELISMVIIEAVPSAGGDTLRATWRDLDGPGGTAPLIDTIEWGVDVEYQVQARVFSGSDEITSEIDNEKDEHQFLWDIDGMSFSFSTEDWDSAPKLYSRRVKVTVEGTGDGTLSVQLYHYDDPADKVSGEPGNETDIDITFPLVVKD